MRQIPIFCLTHIDHIQIGFSTLDYVVSESNSCVEISIDIKSHPEGAPRTFNVSLSTQKSSAGMLELNVCCF